MKGKIIVNGYYFGESEQYRCRRLTEEFARRGITVEVERNASVHAVGETFDCDFALFFDKDIYYCKMLENAGIPVYNSSFVLDATDDKGKTAVFLAKTTSVEMPKTILAPKQFFYQEDRDYLRSVGESLGYPYVVKEVFGSLGEQVYWVRSFEEGLTLSQKIGTKPHLFQAFRSESYGKSVRVLVVGKKAIGGILLQSRGDFRSNAHLGGEASIFELPCEYVKKAEEVAAALDAVYCGVDFFADKPILIEVNGSAYFSEFERITGINVAEIFVENVINDIASRPYRE